MNKERIKYLSPAHIICFEEYEYEQTYGERKKFHVIEITTTETFEGKSVIHRIEFEKGRQTPHFCFIKSMLIRAMKNPFSCNYVFKLAGESYKYEIDAVIK